MEQTIHEITGARVFTLEDAKSIIPLIIKITCEASNKVHSLVLCLEAVPKNKEEIAKNIEAELNDVIEGWRNKIRKLGGLPVGTWLVDFDFGDGYFCWKFPEKDILFWHKKNDGFTGRVPIHDHIERKALT